MSETTPNRAAAKRAAWSAYDEAMKPIDAAYDEATKRYTEARRPIDAKLYADLDAAELIKD